MASGDIKQKIVLEGEKEYSAALKDAQRNLKVLRSELKAETAELGKNATQQQKNETRLKNLQKQIKEQEKVVRTYEKALKEVREKYGDNAEAIAKWEIKLNDARAALGKMKDGLSDVGNSAKRTTTELNTSVIAANSLAESLGKVANTANTISSAMENAFKGVVGAIKDTVSQVWGSVVDLAARSNSLVDLAGFWNTDVTKIQKYKGAVAYASASLSDLNDLVTKINAKAMSGDGVLAGISNEEYTDQWAYAMAVMDSLYKMEGEARNAAAYEIFGKNFTKSLDLLNDWDKVLEHLDEFDVENGGYGLTEEEIQKMSDLYDQVNAIAEKWAFLKDSWLVKLTGDLALNITGNINNILDAFKEYFDAETPAEKDAALKKIEDNIIQIFEHIKDAIQKGIELLDQLAKDLQASDNETAQAIGKILQGFVDALKWLTDENNWNTIIDGFKRLIELWAGVKAFEAAANIASFASHVLALINGGQKLFGNGTEKVTSDAVNEAIKDNTSNVVNAARSGGVTNPYLANGKIDGTLANQAVQQALKEDLGGVAGKVAGKIGDMIDNPAIDTAIAAMVIYPVAKMFTDKASKSQWIRDVKNSKDYQNASDDVKSWMINGYAYEDAVHNANATGRNYHDWWTHGGFKTNKWIPETDIGPVGLETGLYATAQDVIDDVSYWWDRGLYEKLVETYNKIFWNSLDYGDGNGGGQIGDPGGGGGGLTYVYEDQGPMSTFFNKFGGSMLNPILYSDWWKTNSTPGSENTELKNIPGQVKAGIQDGMKGIKVVMNNETVGRLVAPIVSEYIARDVG